MSRDAAGLFLYPGLGKTLVTLETFRRRKEAKQARRMILVAKLRICNLVWPKEIKKWGFNFTYSILHGPNKDKLFDDDSDIHLINYEGLPWLCKKLGIDISFLKTNKFKRRGRVTFRNGVTNKYDMCTLDESSKIKAFGRARTKLAHSIGDFVKFKLILTGSPAPKSLLDIFSQVMFLDGGKALGKFITHFRNDHFYPSGYEGHNWKIIPEHEKLIMNKIKHLIIRFGEEELDLPELNLIARRVELPPAARKVYRDMEKRFVADLQSGLITAATAAVASTKCRQIANGGLYDESKKYHFIHDEKTEELLEIIEEAQGTPVLIAYEYKHDLDRILNLIPDMNVIGGDNSAKGKRRDAELEAAWNRGELQYMAGHPDSIAHGLNLQESGNTVVFYGLTPNLENYEQFILRVRRSGQKAKYVNAIHIVAEGTVDEDTLMLLYNKDVGQQAFLNAFTERLGIKLNNKGKKAMDKKALFKKYFPAPLGPMFSYLPADKQWIHKASKEVQDHNYVLGFVDSIKSWLPTKHVEFLKDFGITGIDPVKSKLRDLYDRTHTEILKLLGVVVSPNGFYVVEDLKLMEELLDLLRIRKMVKESRITNEAQSQTDIDDDDAIANDAGAAVTANAKTRKRNGVVVNDGAEVTEEKLERVPKRTRRTKAEMKDDDSNTVAAKPQGRNVRIEKGLLTTVTDNEKPSRVKREPKMARTATVSKMLGEDKKKPRATKSVAVVKSGRGKPAAVCVYKADAPFKILDASEPRSAVRADAFKIIKRIRDMTIGKAVAALMKQLGYSELKSLQMLEGLADKGHIKWRGGYKVKG